MEDKKDKKRWIKWVKTIFKKYKKACFKQMTKRIRNKSYNWC